MPDLSQVRLSIAPMEHMENAALATQEFSDISAASGLTELEVKVLEFERQWWRYAGAKESSIKELFNLTPPKYYQLLNNLIDRPEALLAAPMLVKRLRRLREARTTTRSAGFTLS
jgi:hypothetical protein